MAMPYMSELIGKPVTDLDGRKIGSLKDLLATVRKDVPHPHIVAVEVKGPSGTFLVPFSDVAVLVAPAIPLSKKTSEISQFASSGEVIYLVRDILDQQLIDVNDVRVVRVNDIELARINGHFYIANVDIGATGLLRRLGLRGIASRIASHPRRGKHGAGIISWDDVEPLAAKRTLRLRVAGDKVEDLHPADLADIISDLGRAGGTRLLESLDPKTAADALEEVEPDFQASLVHAMPDQKVADVLEEMSPDEAADLLAELPEQRSKELLNLMEKEGADDVRRLLSYPEDSAGGIMTTDFIAVKADRSAAEIIAVLRKAAEETETVFNLFVTDEEGRLKGAFTLKELVLALPEARAAEFMDRDAVSVKLLDGQDRVAQVVSKYNLLAVPVVDDEGRLQGIVTADDALDKIIPTAWKKRLPRLYH
jgi:magnesium transporter